MADFCPVDPCRHCNADVQFTIYLGRLVDKDTGFVGTGMQGNSSAQELQDSSLKPAKKDVIRVTEMRVKK